MAKAATDFGATVLLSNHSEFDDAYFKAHTAAHRKPGQRNPFDVGANGVARNFRVVQACTSATRLSGDRGKPAYSPLRKHPPGLTPGDEGDYYISCR